MREALAQVPYDRYPDREALALRRVLSTHLDVTAEQILVGNGSTELVWLVALAFVRAGDTVLLVGPTFGEYTRAAVLMGAHLHQYTARRAESFRVVPEAITQLLQQHQPRLVFLCNPNNPTGTFVAPDSIAHWAATFPRTLFIVDEAYLTFTASAPSVLPVRRPNMLVLRSMTKAYALAGLRLGYAVGSPDILEALRRARPPWSVNALAQAAGIAALAGYGSPDALSGTYSASQTRLRGGPERPWTHASPFDHALFSRPCRQRRGLSSGAPAAWHAGARLCLFRPA